VLAILEEGHYRAEEIDWTQVRESVLPVVQRRPTAEGAYQAIEEALRLLADPHTRFHTPSEAEDLLAESPLPGPVPEGRRLEPGLGYLAVPGASFRFMEEYLSYAQTVRTEMREIDAHQPVCGWVVDLRENSGGSIFPMFHGIGPLFGEGVFLADVSRTGVVRFAYEHGRVTVDGRPLGEAPLRSDYDLDATRSPYVSSPRRPEVELPAQAAELVPDPYEPSDLS
jgi:carboxyl-terminal processing protease